MRAAISSGIVQIDLSDSQRKPNKSRWRGHMVISKWEASTLNTTALRKKVHASERMHPTRSRRVVGSNPFWNSDFFPSRCLYLDNFFEKFLWIFPCNLLERQIKITVNWPLHITCPYKKQFPLGVNTGIIADFVKSKMIIHFLCTLVWWCILYRALHLLAMNNHMRTPW